MLTAIAPGLVPEHRRCMTTSPVPIAAPPPPPRRRLPRLPRRFPVPCTVGARGQGVLALFALVAPVALGVNLAQRDLLTRIQDAPGSVRLSDLQLSDNTCSALNVVWWVFIGLSVVTWMIWWVCAYRAAADRRALRYGKGWAFGGWFVPFANLVVPKRVADDLWTASREPDWPARCRGPQLVGHPRVVGRVAALRRTRVPRGPQRPLHDRPAADDERDLPRARSGGARGRRARDPVHRARHCRVRGAGGNRRTRPCRVTAARGGSRDRGPRRRGRRDGREPRGVRRPVARNGRHGRPSLHARRAALLHHGAARLGARRRRRPAGGCDLRGGAAEW